MPDDVSEARDPTEDPEGEGTEDTPTMALPLPLEPLLPLMLASDAYSASFNDNGDEEDVVEEEEEEEVEERAARSAGVNRRCRLGSGTLPSTTGYDNDGDVLAMDVDASLGE